MEFSSVSRTVYRLGNLFCTIPFRKITFGVEKVGFFFSIGSIFCSFKIGIHHSCTYKFPRYRRMHSHDKRSWLTSANTCVPPFFAGWCTGSPNSVVFRWDFEFISQCIKINKTRPKFHFFFFTKIEISWLFPVLLRILSQNYTSYWLLPQPLASYSLKCPGIAWTIGSWNWSLNCMLITLVKDEN